MNIIIAVCAILFLFLIVFRKPILRRLTPLKFKKHLTELTSRQIKNYLEEKYPEETFQRLNTHYQKCPACCEFIENHPINLEWVRKGEEAGEELMGNIRNFSKS